MAVMVYNDGDSTQGKNIQDFFLTRVARRTIDQEFNFSKFANLRDMMQDGNGNTFHSEAFFWSIHREVVDKDGNYTGVENGYMAERDLDDVQKKLDDMTLTSEGVTDKDAIYKLGTYRKVKFTTKIKKLAGIVELTEDEETYSNENVRMYAIEDATKQMNLAHNDLVMRDILNTTFKVYGGTATSRGELGGDTDSESDKYTLTKKLLTKLYGELIKNKAKPVSSIIVGQNKIGTVPVPSAFYAIVGANLHNALIDEDLFPDFLPVHKYPNPSNMLKMEGLEEIGMLGRFRILYSETLGNYTAQGSKVGDGSAASTVCHSHKDPDDDDNYHYDVFPTIVMSQDAISLVSLQGKTDHKIYTQFPEQIDGTNPIGEKGYIAFKFRYASIIKRPEVLAVAEVTCPI